MKSVSDRGPQKSSYSDICGLRSAQRVGRSSLAGSSFSECDMDILLLSDSAQTSQVEAHFVVEDVISALPAYIEQGYTIAIEPFDITIGKCAVIQDTAGTRICIFDKRNIFTLVDSPGVGWPSEIR
jgi:lactoylglutathione lyase